MYKRQIPGLRYRPPIKEWVVVGSISRSIPASNGRLEKRLKVRAFATFDIQNLNKLAFLDFISHRLNWLTIPINQRVRQWIRRPPVRLGRSWIGSSQIQNPLGCGILRVLHHRSPGRSHNQQSVGLSNNCCQISRLGILVDNPYAIRLRYIKIRSLECRQNLAPRDRAMIQSRNQPVRTSSSTCAQEP